MALDRPDTIRKPDILGKSDAPTFPVPREEAGLPREVYALLAQANLLRMRGCWEEAVGKCMAALRLAPDSPSAQSLLGDIYENQGRFDDAVQWYRMALDARPDSPTDRLKLDRLVQRQMLDARAERRAAPAEPDTEGDPAGATAPAPTGPVSAGPTPPTLGGRLIPLWRRFARNPEAALRFGALAAALLVCLVVVFAYAAVHRRAALATLGLGPFQEVKATPIVVAPTSAPPAPTGADGASRDAAEQAVLGTLRASSGLDAQGVSVGDVQFDPRSRRMTITLSLASGGGPSGGGLTRASVLRSALRAAQGGAAASPSAMVFTLRGLTASGSGGGPALVFVGDVSQSALLSVGATEPDDAHVQALFTDPWWSQQVPG